MAYFDANDTSDKKRELSEREAAQLQLHGHLVVDEEGRSVTLNAVDVINNDIEERRAQARADQAEANVKAAKEDAKEAKKEAKEAKDDGDHVRGVGEKPADADADDDKADSKSTSKSKSTKSDSKAAAKDDDKADKSKDDNRQPTRKETGEEAKPVTQRTKGDDNANDGPANAQNAKQGGPAPTGL